MARVIIEDDDEAPVVLSWSDASATLAEEDGTLSLTAQVTTLGELRPDAGFTVDLTAATADGTATQPEDYTAVSEDFSMRASDFTAVEVDGQSRYRATKGFTVTVLTDTADEPIETFTVTLSYRGTLTPALTGGDAVANVSLTDSNQASVMLEWSAVTLTGAEPTTSGGTTTVTLTAIATTALENAPDPGFDLQFTVMTADGTATQPADYTSLSSTASFEVADFVSVMVDGNQRYRASRDFAVTVADDTIDEAERDFHGETDAAGHHHLLSEHGERDGDGNHYGQRPRARHAELGQHGSHGERGCGNPDDGGPCDDHQGQGAGDGLHR